MTGLGTVGAFGPGREGLLAALAAGRPALASVDRSAGWHLPASARQALLVNGAPLAPWLAPAEARRMSPPSKLAVAAARMALAEAGLAAPLDEPEPGAASPSVLPSAVVLASAFGASSCTEGLLRQVFLESPESASPFLFTESVANAPAAQIGIAVRARGPSVTISQREAGPLLAVARGAAEVAAGRTARALVGAAEEMTPLLHAILDRFGALARPAAGAEEAARPFDRRRAGFLAAEGATVLVLERAADARARGARVLARLLGWGSAFDPTAPPSGWGRGETALGAALGRSLSRAGLAPEELDLVVAGASGTPAGDRLEAATLRAAFAGAALPPVVAPKGVTGEYGGGFLASAVLAAAGARFGPTAGFAEPDPELGVVPHDGRELPAPARVLATSFAAGGAAAWLVLGAAEPDA